MNRRDFIKSSALFSASLVFGNVLGLSKAFGADQVPEGKKACDNSDPVAAALGYTPIAAKIDKKKFPKFKKLTKDNNCKHCALYKEVSGGYGQCTMIANCAVSEKGLCGSWQKKA